MGMKLQVQVKGEVTGPVMSLITVEADVTVAVDSTCWVSGSASSKLAKPPNTVARDCHSVP